MNKVLCLSLVAACISLSCISFAGERNEGTPPGTAGVESQQAATAEGKKIMVAEVNGTGISLQSVLEMMNRLSAREGRGPGTTGDREKIRKEAVDRLILEELAFQKAKGEGMTAGPGEVEKRVADLKGKLGGDETFKKALEKEGLTEHELRAEIERNIILRQIFARDVAGKVPPISEDEVKKAYAREKDSFVKAEKVVITDIVFFLNPEERSSAEKAEQVLKKVLDDKEKDPWKLVPDGTFIVQDIEIKKEKQKELYAEARKLKPGELSGVIPTRDSLHIIEMKEYSPEKQLTLDEMRAFLENKLRAEAREKRVRTWESELRKGATIKMLDTMESKTSPGSRSGEERPAGK